MILIIFMYVGMALNFIITVLFMSETDDAPHGARDWSALIIYAVFWPIMFVGFRLSYLHQRLTRYKPSKRLTPNIKPVISGPISEQEACWFWPEDQRPNMFWR